MRCMAMAIAACAALGALAEDGGHWYTQVDNDVFYGTDRWYTSGVRIARVASAGDHDVEWGLLQEIFTPEAKRHNPIDRPPAARMLASYARHDRTPGDWRTFEVSVGVTGPAALGRQAQDLIHRVFPAPHEDWSQQRSNRFDGQLAWVRTVRVDHEPDGNPRVNLHYGAVAGNQIDFVHAGLELRFGHGPAMELATPALRFAATPPVLAAGAGHSWSGFIAASVRGVMRNHFLDLQDGAGLPVVRSNVVRRFMGGVAWSGERAAVVFAVVRDTPEFAGQRRDHGFGSVTVHVPF